MRKNAKFTITTVVVTGLLIVSMYWINVLLANHETDNTADVEEVTTSSTEVVQLITHTTTPTPIEEIEVEEIAHTFIFDNTICELRNEDDYDERPFELPEQVVNCRYSFSNGFYVRDTYNLEVDSYNKYSVTYKSKAADITVRVQEHDSRYNTVDALKTDYVEAHGFIDHSVSGMPRIPIGSEWNEEHGLLSYADFYNGDYSMNYTESAEGLLYCDEELKLTYGPATFFQYYDTEKCVYNSLCIIRCIESGRILCIEIKNAEDSRYPLAVTIEVVKDGIRLYK